MSIYTTIIYTVEKQRQIFKNNEFCFLLDCDGGTRTDISGQLNFLRGPGPHERECEWTIEDTADNDNVIVSGFRNSEDCG